jgi:predicted dehydrogenase
MVTRPVDRPVRVGVIGLGLASRTHLDGYLRAEGCELAAVCDTAARKLRPVVHATGVPGTTDHREILTDPAIDAVVLLLPHLLHHPVGVEALEAGKHVCMAKPFTITAAQADDLIELADRAGLTLAVAESTRYVGAYIEARRMIQQGKLGEIRMVRCFNSDQILDEWADVEDETQFWKQEANGCGVLQDCGPHLFDLLTWFFGEMETIQAAARSWVPGIPLDNHSVVTGRMVSGELFSIEVCSLTEYPHGERVEIYGSEGTLIIDQVLDPPMVLYRGSRDLRGTPVAGVGYDIEGWKARSTQATAADFVDAVRSGRAPRVTARESRYVVSLIERAYASIASGGLEFDARRSVHGTADDPA